MSTFVSTNPANIADVVAEVPAASVADIVDALRRAKSAQKGWASLPAPARGRVIANVGRLFEKNKETLSQLVTREIEDRGFPVGHILMASLATVIKRDLSGMGKWLFVGAIVMMVGGIINVFVGSSVGMMVLSMMGIGIFSAYMLYDIKQIIDGGEDNYISATLSLYLDIVNVFQSLLALLGIFGGERD